MVESCWVSIDVAVEALGRGEILVVVDDENREDEGDLVMAAEFATREKLAFFVRHTAGLICAPLSGERCDELHLHPMVAHNTDAHGTAFTESVDLMVGTTTGISASDRAATLRALADPGTRPGDLSRPGHLFPLRAREGGVLKRAGHTEAAVDLARLAGCAPAAAICEVVCDDGRMARAAELSGFAREHRLPMISIADLVAHRYRSERLVERIAETTVPTNWGRFRCVAYQSTIDGTEHVAFVYGDIDPAKPVLTRVHSECLTGDVFGSGRCDCGAQLAAAMGAIVEAGAGVVVYLRGHEGRGIGIGHKIQAYSLQDEGHDTVDANLALGLPVDDREYGIGAQILVDLGARRLDLMTNNPAKYAGLRGYGIEINRRVPVPTFATPDNIAYLRTKQDRMGHLLQLEEVGAASVCSPA